MEHFPNKMLASLFMSTISRFLASFDSLLYFFFFFFFFFFATGSELLLHDEEESSLLELDRARLRLRSNLLPDRPMVRQKQTKLGQ